MPNPKTPLKVMVSSSSSSSSSSDPLFESYHLTVTLNKHLEETSVSLETLPRHHDSISEAVAPVNRGITPPILAEHLNPPSQVASSFSPFDLDTIIRRPTGRLDYWIHFAASRSIPNLDLSFDHPSPHTCDNPRIPYSLIRLSSQNLASLILTSFCFPKDDDFPGFPLLKTLHLKFVQFTRRNLSRLLSSVPSLESLVIYKSHWLPNLTVTPHAFPKLVRIEFVHHSDSDPQNLNVQLAPNLRNFYFSGAIQRLHLHNCPQLRVAQIRSAGRGVLSCRRVMKIAEVFANVNSLIVGYWFFPHYEHPLPNNDKMAVLCTYQHVCSLAVPVFAKLKEFHCHGILLHKTTMKKLLVFICRCPLMEKLCINESDMETITVYNFGISVGDKLVFSSEPSMLSIPLDQGRLIDMKISCSKLWVLKEDDSMLFDLSVCDCQIICC